MATYYLDWDNGNDSNNGLSPETAWKSYDAKQLSTAPDDVFFFKRGTTQIVTTAALNVRNGFRFYAYGTGPRPRWVAQGAAVATGMILNFSRRSNMIVEDQDFDAAGVTRALYCAAQGSSFPTSGITFRRCLFRNATANGVDVIQEQDATATASNYVFEDCEFYDNGGHGSLVMGNNHQHVRCKAYRNGATVVTGGHGFSARAARTAVSSGWTLTSGTVYQRTLAAHEVTVFGVYDLGGSGPLTQNTSTPTNPSVQQFGQSGTTLYINLGLNPNGRNIDYQWGTTANLRYVDCEAWGNIWYRPGAFREGHGFAADDWVSNSQYVGCISRNNEGLGFSFNRGGNNKLLGCVATNNGFAGLVANSGASNEVHNCVFLDNNQVTPIATYEIAFSSPTSTNCRVTNSVLSGSVANGIQFEPTATGTVTNCAINGYTNATVNATATGTITTNVRAFLRSDASLVVPSTATIATVGTDNPLATSGTYVPGVTLANGRLRPGFAPIGAYQAVVPRAARA